MKTKAVAKKLQSLGQGEDTILAHINPEEAAMLKAGGGSGKRDPKTGLLSFGGYEGEGTDFAGDGYRGGDAWADPNAGMSLADQYAAYGSGRQLAEMQNGYGYGATPSMLGQLATQFNNLNPIVKSALPSFLNIGSYVVRNSPLGTNTNGAGGIVQSGADKYAGDALAQAESGYGGDYAGSGVGGAAGLLGQGAPTAQPAALPSYTRPAFVSKWGKPRGAAFTDPYAKVRRGLLGG